MNKRTISLSGLRGFLAASRSGSFTRAAKELHLTQSALSRQIQGLEDEVGTPLFVRTTRKVALTAAGVRLAQAATGALAQIDAAVEEIRPGSGSRPITVTTFASFASLWLIPHLADFSSAHPGIDVTCMATDRIVDIEQEGFDLALRAVFGSAADSGEGYLFDELVVPVAAPALLLRAPLMTTADLAQHTWLALDARHDLKFPDYGWPQFLATRGHPGVKPKNILRFTNHDQVIQAALAGQGVAIARAALIGETLLEGRLLPVLGAPLRPRIQFHIVLASAARQRPEVQAFNNWVHSEAAKTRQRLQSVFGTA